MICPLSDKVVSIDVKVGDPVQEGAQVATVEAMKMNTYIYAPRAGRVGAVLVKAGDGVEEGTALLTEALPIQRAPRESSSPRTKRIPLVSTVIVSALIIFAIAAAFSMGVALLIKVIFVTIRKMNTPPPP